MLLSWNSYKRLWDALHGSARFLWLLFFLYALPLHFYLQEEYSVEEESVLVITLIHGLINLMFILLLIISVLKE